MERKTYEQIEQIAQELYRGKISLETAKEAVLDILSEQCGPYDVVLTGMCWTMLGIADDLLAATIPTVLSSYTPPDNVLDTLQELAEMFIICGGDIPGELTLYRGVNDIVNNGLDMGYCYTTDYDVAAWYARGMVCFHEPEEWTSEGTVYTVRVPMRYIIGRTKSHKESEVIVLPPAAGGQIEVLKADRVS